MIAINWAKNLGWRSNSPFYKALAIAILVEEYGIGETAKHIGETWVYVKNMLEVYEISSQPEIELKPAEYAKCLRKLLKVFNLEELSRRLKRPAIDLQLILTNNPEGR